MDTSRFLGLNFSRSARFVAAVFALTCLVSCSLLKVSVSTGEPLSEAAMDTRVMTRGFYYEFSEDVVRTADSIANGASKNVQIAALRWKIRSTRAAVTAAMQSIPDVAMADLWLLSRRMNEEFQKADDGQLFGSRSPMARACAQRLSVRAERLAEEVLPSDKLSLMRQFVEEYMAENPSDTSVDGVTNTTMAWVQFLKRNGVETDYTTGSIAEVLADVNDRMSGQTQQISNSIGWSKDLIELQLRQDSLRSEIGSRLDSLEGNFERMVVVAEGLPRLTDETMKEIGRQLTMFTLAINSTFEEMFFEVERQRGEVQNFVRQEREALTREVHQSLNELIQNALAAIPSVISKSVFAFVVGILLLLGLPFLLGLWVGGLRQKAKLRKTDKKGTDE